MAPPLDICAQLNSSLGAGNPFTQLSWLDLAETGSTTASSIFIAFRARYRFTSWAAVHQNKPTQLVDIFQSPCLREDNKRSFLDSNISQAIQLMSDIFTGEVAAKVSQKAFMDSKWNKVTPPSVQVQKRKKKRKNIFQCGSHASLEFPPSKPRAPQPQDFGLAPHTRPPPAQEFIVVPRTRCDAWTRIGRERVSFDTHIKPIANWHTPALGSVLHPCPFRVHLSPLAPGADTTPASEPNNVAHTERVTTSIVHVIPLTATSVMQPAPDLFVTRLAALGYDINGPPSYAIATGQAQSHVHVVTHREVIDN
ncbi:uncharacterized protein F5147DRAFT_766334 [Suillus discolor]|uniref:Uncharacterized protein n=1 Tax=Suillus discolor TaxID=1912936 RepID=A0A9P7FM68_9AGAM|nr:uncharacterized protein F5147DRAFT_766334 [Suillus discolor]KAG2120418.1 hypothetical protein F5147DRAFT_766334 [Suillus discolor]